MPSPGPQARWRRSPSGPRTATSPPSTSIRRVWHASASWRRISCPSGSSAPAWRSGSTAATSDMSARSKNLWTLLGAAVVALGLGLYAWLGVMKGEEREEEKKRTAERLVQPVSRPDGGTETIRYDRLVVKAKGETTELGRLPDQSWVISRPVKAAANVRAAEDIVGTLQYSRVKSTVEETPTAEDLKKYGLDAPAAEVTASASGAPPLSLRLGKANPYNDSVYVQKVGDPKVYAMDKVARA